MQSSDVLEIALRQGFSKDQTAAALRVLTDLEVERLAWMVKWVEHRHEFQVVPPGEWSTWLVLAGRGSGKTQLGSEWTGMCAAMAAKDDRSLVVAPTKGDLRDVCFEGDSGLVRSIPGSLIKYYHKSPSPQIMLHNGAMIGGIAAVAFERTRGPQWNRAWCDEVAAWGADGKVDPEEVWETMEMSVRLGDDTRILCTTTPKPKPLIKRLVADSATVITTASTHVNLDNLSPEFARRIMKYQGTKIGRQEIYAELIDAEDGGIISRSWLKMWPAEQPLPTFDYIVASLDTAFSEEAYDKKKQKTDPSAMSVWGCFRLPVKGKPHEKGKPGIMLLDCWAEHLGLPDLVTKVKKETDRDKIRYGQSDRRPIIAPQRGPKNAFVNVGRPIDLILIEGKASGKSLRQFLAKDGIMTQEFNPGNADKLTRGHVVSPIAKDGIIWVPESTSRPGKFMTWAEPLVEQVCSYSGEGSVVHDDLYDTFTQAMRVIDWQWLHYLEQAEKQKRTIGPDSQTHRPRAFPVNPYAE
jgi:predicted phage terminase large subunit-like protein